MIAPHQDKNFELRPGESHHQKFVNDLMRKFSHQVGFLPTDAIAEFIARRWVTIDDENATPAGCLLVRPMLMHDPLSRQIIVTAVHMDAARRSHGLRLVADTCNAAIAAGQRFVQAWCREDIEATEFWKAAGFVAVARRHAPTTSGHGHILYRRSVGEISADIFNVTLPFRERGPGGKFKSEEKGVPGWEYEAVMPHRVRNARMAESQRQPPMMSSASKLLQEGRSFSNSSTQCRKFSTAAA